MTSRSASQTTTRDRPGVIEVVVYGVESELVALSLFVLGDRRARIIRQATRGQFGRLLAGQDARPTDQGGAAP